jgi:hypothetical protein
MSSQKASLLFSGVTAAPAKVQEQLSCVSSPNITYSSKSFSFFFCLSLTVFFFTGVRPCKSSLRLYGMVPVTIKGSGEQKQKNFSNKFIRIRHYND